MTEAGPELDEDRLRRLVRELETVVRRELPWHEGSFAPARRTWRDCLARWRAARR